MNASFLRASAAPLAALALLTAGAVAALGTTAGAPDATSPVPNAHPVYAPPTASVPDGIARHFRGFRAQRTSADTAPIQSGDALAAESGANPRLARRLLRTRRGDTAYMVPSRDGVCIASTSFWTITCASADVADAGGLSGTIICAPNQPGDSIGIYGILPDGVQDVTVVRADGSEQPIGLEGNGYSIQAPKSEPLPTSITWTDATGAKQEKDAAVPDDAGQPCGPH